MFLVSVTNRGVEEALGKTLAFYEARLRVTAENVANIHTPGYRAKQLDAAGFRRSLGEALESRRRQPDQPLRVASGSEVHTDDQGRMQVTPSLRPVDNVLFHDGTNLSIEREMAELAQTGLMHQHAAALLREKFDVLRTAIRGTPR
jgi:flagellar basal-body rod protein FlgB